jgi:hypothetical protein
MSLDASNKLWISFTNKIIKIRHFSISFFCSTISGTSSRVMTHIDLWKYLKKIPDSSSICIFSKFFCYSVISISRSFVESMTLLTFCFAFRDYSIKHKWNFLKLKMLCKIYKHVYFMIRKRKEKILYESNGHSWIMIISISSDSLHQGLLDRGSLQSSILSSAKW